MINPWYDSALSKAVLDSTDGGKFLFVWEARLNDGNVMRQFEDHTFDILRNNPSVPIPQGVHVSTDIIPRDKIVEFVLYPTALAKTLPWFRDCERFLITVDPAKEHLLAYWLVDKHIAGGPSCGNICRHVMGTMNRETQKRSLMVISPSGKVHPDLPNDDQSFEGE